MSLVRAAVGAHSRRIISKNAFRLQRQRHVVAGAHAVCDHHQLHHGRSLTTSPKGVLLPPFEGTQPISFIDYSRPSETEITQLSNGLKVASENVPGSWCAVSVIVSSGSRFEESPYMGVNHFMDRLAYKSTESFSEGEVLERLSKLGGNFMCSSNRETIMYQGMVFVDDLEEAMQLLSEVVMKGKYTEEEIMEQRQMLAWEMESITDNPDAFLPELLHRAAYGSETLGRQLICSEEDARDMKSESIVQYRDAFFQSDRMTIAGAGMPHDLLVELADKYFGNVPVGDADDNLTLITRPARYLGGSRLYPMDKSPTNNAQEIPLTQIGLGFEGTSWEDSDIYPIAVLQLLLGGGSSFSVGGPGKGMMSRMYTHVMTIHPWTDMAMAMNMSYMDSGIFYICGAAPPAKVQTLLDVLVKEFVLVAASVSEVETARARNQLKASLLMNLESKTIACEDIGRQVLAFGYRMSADELIEKIDAVTAVDIMRVATRMLGTAPCFAAYGQIDKLVDYEVLIDNINRTVDRYI